MCDYLCRMVAFKLAWQACEPREPFRGPFGPFRSHGQAAAAYAKTQRIPLGETWTIDVVHDDEGTLVQRLAVTRKPAGEYDVQTWNPEA